MNCQFERPPLRRRQEWSTQPVGLLEARRPPKNKHILMRARFKKTPKALTRGRNGWRTIGTQACARTSNSNSFPSSVSYRHFPVSLSNEMLGSSAKDALLEPGWYVEEDAISKEAQPRSQSSSRVGECSVFHVLGSLAEHGLQTISVPLCEPIEEIICTLIVYP